MSILHDLPAHDTGLSPGCRQSDFDDERREPAPLSIPDAVDALLDRHDRSRTTAALREQAEEILTDDYLSPMVRAHAEGNRRKAAQLGIELAEALHKLVETMDAGTYAARLDADMAE